MALSDSRLRLRFDPAADADEVLKPGARVQRTDFYEGDLTLDAVNHKEGLLILRRAGHTSWINRGVGSKYSPAALIVCRFWLSPIKGTNKQEVWVRGVMETPVKGVKA